MGVKTTITLKEANNLFEGFEFKKLTPTKDGVMDTTYFADGFVLKKYERDVDVKRDIELLNILKKNGLDVPTCRAKNDPFYLYEKLNGLHVKSVKTFHIVAMARFFKTFHNIKFKTLKYDEVVKKEEVKKLLNFTKTHFFYYYKKLHFLQNYNLHVDGVIHADMFKDNVLFEKQKVKVFDFIDSANGSFLFDVGVFFVGFGIDEKLFYKKLFLKIYNPKIKLTQFEEAIKYAKAFYALKRIEKYKNTKKAKELL